MLALIEHGTLVRNFLDSLQEQKEQEATRLRVARKLQYVYRVSVEIHHLSQYALFAGSTRELWL
jgi:hypothetical protein